MRTRARVVRHAEDEICRVDIGKSSRPVWAKTSKSRRILYVRQNNTSREIAGEELEQYVADHWPGR